MANSIYYQLRFSCNEAKQLDMQFIDPSKHQFKNGVVFNESCMLLVDIGPKCPQRLTNKLKIGDIVVGIGICYIVTPNDTISLQRGEVSPDITKLHWINTESLSFSAAYAVLQVFRLNGGLQNLSLKFKRNDLSMRYVSSNTSVKYNLDTGLSLLRNGLLKDVFKVTLRIKPSSNEFGLIFYLIDYNDDNKVVDMIDKKLDRKFQSFVPNSLQTTLKGSLILITGIKDSSDCYMSGNYSAEKIVKPGLVLLQCNNIRLRNLSLTDAKKIIKTQVLNISTATFIFGVPADSSNIGVEKFTDRRTNQRIDVLIGSQPINPPNKRKISDNTSNLEDHFHKAKLKKVTGVRRDTVKQVLGFYGRRTYEIGIGTSHQVDIPSVSSCKKTSAPATGQKLIQERMIEESPEKLPFGWNSILREAFLIAVYVVGTLDFKKIRLQMTNHLQEILLYDRTLRRQIKCLKTLENIVASKMNTLTRHITINKIVQYFYTNFKNSSSFISWYSISKSRTREKNIFHNDLCSACLRGGEVVMCDTCNLSFDIECLQLGKVPEGLWSCPDCEEDLSKYRNKELLRLVASKYISRIDLEMQD